MNWALIGSSTIASHCMVNMCRSQANGSVCWVFSESASHVTEYAGKYGTPRSSAELSDALSDPDVDPVCTSATNEKHFGQANAAIASGKHNLREKPLALTLDEARAMVLAAERDGVVFATSHHLRCSGRDAVASGTCVMVDYGDHS